ncbi:hypothetical protein AB0N29_11100 [Nocardioides sp. NPDC092400]|uniref:hypothetical protein n=1 Tax=Nocardioides sp. NPDC092400 TaxID=3155196 RepID=UPI00344819BC
MTRLRALAGVLAVLVVAAAVGVCGTTAPASYAAGPGRGTGAEDLRVQRVTVAWNGAARNKVFTRTAVVPGIGTLTLVCRPDATLVRLRANDRSAETQMWMAKHETKNDRAVVAVKTARVYRYATAADDGRGGTGAYAGEGLNQRASIENYSSGHLDGVISQRPGRHRPAAGVSPKPVTSFEVNWWWTGFEHPMSWRSCRIDAVLRTRLDQRIGVSWHGAADAARGSSQVTSVPGLGDLHLRCDAGSGGPGEPDGERSIALVPRSPDAHVHVEQVQGEGLVEDHVEELDLPLDPETGMLGPLPLPRNGMLRLFFTVDGVQRGYVVSSYVVVNDEVRPELNVCEVAAAQL